MDRIVKELQLVLSVKGQDAGRKVREAKKVVDDYRKTIDKTRKTSNTWFKQTQGGVRVFGQKGLLGAIALVRNELLLYAFAIGGVINAFKTFMTNSKEMEMALMGVKSIAQGFGHDVVAAGEIVKDFAATGLISMKEAANSVKMLLSMQGVTTDMARDAMQNLMDWAAFNRLGQYSVGEAVEVTTRGLKEQRSQVTDAVGWVTNLDSAWKKYAKTIGKSVGTLTEAEKNIGSLTILAKESSAVMGDAEKATELYGGKLTKLNVQYKEMTSLLGNTIKPFFDTLVVGLTELYKRTTDYIRINEMMITSGIDELFGGLSTDILAIAEAMGKAIPLVAKFVSENRELLKLWMEIQIGQKVLGGIGKYGAGLLKAAKAGGLWGVVLTSLAALLGVLYAKQEKDKRIQDELNVTFMEKIKLQDRMISQAKILAEDERKRLEEQVKQINLLDKLGANSAELFSDRERLRENIKALIDLEQEYSKTLRQSQLEQNIRQISFPDTIALGMLPDLKNYIRSTREEQLATIGVVRDLATVAGVGTDAFNSYMEVIRLLLNDLNKLNTTVVEDTAESIKGGAKETSKWADVWQRLRAEWEGLAKTKFEKQLFDLKDQYKKDSDEFKKALRLKETNYAEYLVNMNLLDIVYMNEYNKLIEERTNTEMKAAELQLAALKEVDGAAKELIQSQLDYAETVYNSYANLGNTLGSTALGVFETIQEIKNNAAAQIDDLNDQYARGAIDQTELQLRKEKAIIESENRIFNAQMQTYKSLITTATNFSLELLSKHLQTVLLEKAQTDAIMAGGMGLGAGLLLGGAAALIGYGLSKAFPEKDTSTYTAINPESTTTSSDRQRFGSISSAPVQYISILPSVSVQGEQVFIGSDGIEEFNSAVSELLGQSLQSMIDTGEISLNGLSPS